MAFCVCKGCFRFMILRLFFVYSCGEVLKTRPKKEEIKKQLIDSMIRTNIVETEELNEKADKVEKPEDTADVIKQYADIIRAKKKDMSIAYHQGKVFKRFREKEIFMQMIGKLNIHKSAVIFKINIFKLIDNDPKFMNSLATLGFLGAVTKTLSKFVKKIQESLNR